MNLISIALACLFMLIIITNFIGGVHSQGQTDPPLVKPFPSNLVVFANDPATIECYSINNASYTLTWIHRKFNDTGDIPIVKVANGSVGETSYYKIVNEEVNSAVRNMSVIIPRVSASDAGYYVCHWSRLGLAQISYSAQLTVLEGNVKCGILMDQMTNSYVSTGTEGNNATFHCLASYFSDDDPSATLRYDRTTKTSKTGTVQFWKILDSSDNGKQMECNFRFNHNPYNGSVALPSSIFSSTVPSNSVQKCYRTFNIQYRPKNISVVYDKDKAYVPGDTLTCSAVGNPAVNYMWINENGTEVSAINELIITPSMEGNANLTCQAWNKIQNKKIVTSASINILVVVPTTMEPPVTTLSSNPILGSSKAESPMKPGEIIGIVLALIALLIIIIIIICCFIRRKNVKANAVSKAAKSGPHSPPINQISIPPSEISFIDEKPPIADLQDSTVMYGDLGLDDTPRSRKPIQVYESMQQPFRLSPHV